MRDAISKPATLEDARIHSACLKLLMRISVGKVTIAPSTVPSSNGNTDPLHVRFSPSPIPIEHSIPAVIQRYALPRFAGHPAGNLRVLDISSPAGAIGILMSMLGCGAVHLHSRSRSTRAVLRENAACHARKCTTLDQLDESVGNRGTVSKNKAGFSQPLWVASPPAGPPSAARILSIMTTLC